MFSAVAFLALSPLACGNDGDGSSSGAGGAGNGGDAGGGGVPSGGTAAGDGGKAGDAGSDTTSQTLRPSEGVERSAPDPDAPMVELAAGFSDAGFELWRTQPAEQNLVFSPLSIGHALLMARAAADEETAESIDVAGAVRGAGNRPRRMKFAASPSASPTRSGWFCKDSQNLARPWLFDKRDLAACKLAVGSFAYSSLGLFDRGSFEVASWAEDVLQTTTSGPSSLSRKLHLEIQRRPK